jgi:hypothetical protein
LLQNLDFKDEKSNDFDAEPDDAIWLGNGTNDGTARAINETQKG